MNLRILPYRSLLSKKNLILGTAFFIYGILFTYNLLLTVLKPGLNDWVFTDWLINYSSGFVRRGFGGSVLLFFANHFGLNIHTGITFFVYITYFIVAFIYLQKILKNYHLLDIKNLAVLLLSPSLLLFPLIDSAALGRKEILFIIPLIINIFFVEKVFKNTNVECLEKQVNLAANKYCLNIFVWFNLIAIPLALIHESIIFLSLPVNVIITVSFLSLKLSRKNSLFTALIIYFPTLIAILAGFIWKGDTSVALNICESWQGLTEIACGGEAPAAIGAIGWSLRQGISLAWSIVKTKHGFLFMQWLLLFALNFILLVFASSTLISNILGKLNSQQTNKLGFSKIKQLSLKFSFKYIVVPMIFSIPLYILGWDWGRWFYITAVSYAFCCLSPSLVQLETLKQNSNRNINLYNSIYQGVFWGYSKVFSSIFYILKRYLFVYIAFLIYMLFFVTLPHCCLVDSVFHQGLFSRLISIF